VKGKNALLRLYQMDGAICTMQMRYLNQCFAEVDGNGVKQCTHTQPFNGPFPGLPG